MPKGCCISGENKAVVSGSKFQEQVKWKSENEISRKGGVCGRSITLVVKLLVGEWFSQRQGLWVTGD